MAHDKRAREASLSVEDITKDVETLRLDNKSLAEDNRALRK